MLWATFKTPCGIRRTSVKTQASIPQIRILKMKRTIYVSLNKVCSVQACKFQPDLLQVLDSRHLAFFCEREALSISVANHAFSDTQDVFHPASHGDKIGDTTK